MANKKGKTEHSGSKKAKGSYWGKKKDAKKESRKVRRSNDMLEEEMQDEYDFTKGKRNITRLKLNIETKLNIELNAKVWKEFDGWASSTLNEFLTSKGSGQEECLSNLKTEFENRIKTLPNSCRLVAVENGLSIVSNSEPLKDLGPRVTVIYGNVDLSKEDLDFKNAKIRITGMIDFETYSAIKVEAENTGQRYLELINKILSEYAKKNK